jgi:hypothetical protein
VEVGCRRVRYPHDTAARRAWKDALRATRDEWEAAYERRPRAAASAVWMLLAEVERESSHGLRVSA